MELDRDLMECFFCPYWFSKVLGKVVFYGCMLLYEKFESIISQVWDNGKNNVS